MDDLQAFLALLPQRARARVAERSLAKGARLFASGDRPKAMHCVLDGEIRLTRTSRLGTEIIFQRTKSGFVAEASLYHDAYHCDAVAFASSRILSIPRQDFRDALANHEFRSIWLQNLCGELRQVRSQRERASLRSAKDRIIHFIETEGRDGRLVLTQSKKTWSAEIGLSHEALYRTLRAMTDHGDLIVDGQTIRLTNRRRR